MKQYKSEFNPKNEEFKYSLMDADEGEFLGFFKNWNGKEGIQEWRNLEGFEWLSKEKKEDFIKMRNEFLKEDGQDISSALYRVPQKIRSLQIGGMTKGHFHKEIPVILHGGELVIPKKHVEEVMKQSGLAKKISKIPPTWTKIKKIIK